MGPPGSVLTLDLSVSVNFTLQLPGSVAAPIHGEGLSGFEFLILFRFPFLISINLVPINALWFCKELESINALFGCSEYVEEERKWEFEMGVAWLMFCSNGFRSLAGLVAPTRVDDENGGPFFIFLGVAYGVYCCVEWWLVFICLFNNLSYYIK